MSSWKWQFFVYDHFNGMAYSSILCIICSRIHFSILLLLSSVKFHVVYDYQRATVWYECFHFRFIFRYSFCTYSLSFTLFSCCCCCISLLLLGFVLFCYCSRFLLHWKTNWMQCSKLDKMIKPKIHMFLWSQVFFRVYTHRTLDCAGCILIFT